MKKKGEDGGCKRVSLTNAREEREGLTDPAIQADPPELMRIG